MLFQRTRVRFPASTWQLTPVCNSKIRHRNTCRQNTSTHKIKISYLEKGKGRRLMILRNKGTSWRSVIDWKGPNLSFAKTSLPCWGIDFCRVVGSPCLFPCTTRWFPLSLELGRQPRAPLVSMLSGPSAFFPYTRPLATNTLSLLPPAPLPRTETLWPLSTGVRLAPHCTLRRLLGDVLAPQAASYSARFAHHS